MNQVTRDIMRILGVDADKALAIQHKMDCSGIDYSECTKAQFTRAVREAASE